MLEQLFFSKTAAQAIIIFALCIITGRLIGKIKFGTVSLGVGGVLFSSIAAGHFGLSMDEHVLHFAREFGLILFVYSVGMQVGPSFIESLKRSGLSLNLMAAFIVCFGAVIAGACFVFFDVPLPVIVGLYSGAVTNTPSLAASTQMFADLLPNGEMVVSYIQQAGLGYAAAYPFGIIGIILSILLVRYIFRIDIEKENKVMEEQSSAAKPQMDHITLEVVNKNLIGKRLDFLESFQTQSVAFSRVEKMKGIVQTPKAETILTEGALVLAVGDIEELEKLVDIFGKIAAIDLREVTGALNAVDITVSNEEAAGKNIDELLLGAAFGRVVTQIIRSGVEFTASSSILLQLGDKVRIVSDADGIYTARKILGDSQRVLEHPHIMPLFVAIFLGVLLGSIPLYIPGLPAGLKLGLAGGPLLVAIVLSRMHKVGGMVCFISPSASLMVREIGISLFLAAVGLNAGPGFIPMLVDGSGMYWMSIGALITFIPLMTTALFACIVLKANYPTICGLLSGSMTDPPALAFSTQILGTDSSASVYATVYPLTMILRILSSQLLVMFLFHYSS